MTTLPPTPDTLTRTAPPPDAAAAVVAVRALLVGLGADPGYVRRVAAWGCLAGDESWVYVPPLPLPVAQRLATLGGVR